MPEADSSPEPKPAPRLGSYLLVEALGSGGMSNVFRAVHEGSGNVVAVKVLPRTLAKNPTLLQRFIREAKSAESLDHPNIVSIYDRGFDQGRHYLVLEFVEGRDLHDRVRLKGPLEPSEAIGFVREVAEGLRYAASRGMIHRDVKPANLLMTPDGKAKIIDLGLALQIEDEDERVTRDGTTVGTVDYMAPEQARDSRQTSERSDIYSLGCTFYYLLTGSAPYPGGDLSDKLSRHFKAPIPEVRLLRPEVSDRLSLLIRKMMEKKPDRRFHDYTELIAGLDALSQPEIGREAAAESGALVLLDALIDDDDDDDEIGLAPTESSIGREESGPADRPPSTRDHLLMAEIVDDDEPAAPPPSSRSVRAPARPQPAEPAEISLVELAALDTPAPRKRGPSPTSNPAVVSAGAPKSVATRPSTTAPAILPDDDDEPVFGSGGPPRKSSGDELPLKTWIAAGVMVGLAIAILGFGASLLLSINKPDRLANLEVGANEPTPATEPDRDSRPIPQPTRPTPIVKKTVPPAPIVAEAPPPAPVPEVSLEEKEYPADWESRLARPSVESIAPPSTDRPRVVVRRAIQAGDEPQTTSLASALSRAGDLVEIADSGPFFEDDCQVAGKSRWIHARGGIRPMIKIEFASNEIVKDQAAKFILGGSKVDQLVLEGLDIAVDVRDLPDHQQALFLCQGAELILRDCSLTILNAGDATRAVRFAVFRVEDGAKPNRIVLERSVIRGPSRTIFDLVAARAEVVVDRSMLVGDLAPLVVMEPSDKAARSIHFRRSLVVTRGSVVESAGKGAAPRVRSLGTTFARLEPSSNPAAFIACKGVVSGEPSTVVDWSGEDNVFCGWPGWLSAGVEPSTRLSGLDGLRSAWPGSDLSSRETSTPWVVPGAADEVVPGSFATLAPERRATLVRMATPHPRLKELTIGSLARLVTPELSETLIAPYQAPPAEASGSRGPTLAPKPAPLPPPDPNAKGPRRKTPAPPVVGGPALKPAAPPGPLNLVFNVQEAPWLGDLGLFLAEKLVPGTPQATIRVRGSGVHAMTPIRLAHGLSIAILGEAVEGSVTPMATFTTRPSAAGRAMIELRGGDLAIANLGFTTEGSTRPLHWIQSEDGLLAIRHCRFRDPPGATGASKLGAVIAFGARGTEPIRPRVGPFDSSTDRPTARLKNTLIWTAGDALSAEVGRGVVDLENCLVISGGPAVTLVPLDVPRDKFEADLILDRCTLATDRIGLLLLPQAGSSMTPARPWLVSTRRCAFPRTQVAGPGALLQVDPEAMARGALFWVSVSDTYEVARFLGPTGPSPANLPPADLKRQWVDLWGREHTKGDQGPNPRRNDPLLRYKDKDRPKPGKVSPGSLELDPKVAKDLGVDFKDLPRS